MKYRYLIFCFFLLAGSQIRGQDLSKNVTGQVSFVSSQNVYVRFTSTTGISVHDTLFISTGSRLVPALVVDNISPSSCLCTQLTGESLPVGHLIIARARNIPRQAEIPLPDTSKPEAEPAKEITKAALPAAGEMSRSLPAEKKGRHEKIAGSLSAASYSDFSNTPGPGDQRFRYTLSINAANIGNSPLSADVYVSFRHRSGSWDEIRKNVFNGLKIYSLALKYDIDTTMSLKLGRQINQRIANIGAFDGLAAEKSVGGFSFGLAGGSRPDYMTYGFDFNLMQFGGYISYDHNSADSYSSTSLAFMDQLNSGKTDRRFLYLQHSGLLAKNLSVFGSVEADLYKLVNNQSQTSFSLTSFYFYLNYRLSDRASVGVSYDARKNPIYYETARTLLDTLRENALRQSYRVNASIRLSSTLRLGIQSSYRYLKTDIKKSGSAGGYLSYTPKVKNYLALTLSGDYITTGYMNGYSGDLSFLTSLAKGRMQAGAGYRYQQYSLPESLQNLTQHMANVNVYWQLYKKLSLSVDYELTFEGKARYNRVYLQLLKRF